MDKKINSMEELFLKREEDLLTIPVQPKVRSGTQQNLHETRRYSRDIGGFNADFSKIEQDGGMQ